MTSRQTSRIWFGNAQVPSRVQPIFSTATRTARHNCLTMPQCGILHSLTLDRGGINSMYVSTWWRHQMETFSALLAICAGNSPVPDEFPTTLRLNKRLSKQWWCWWFETLSRPLWRHRNEVYFSNSFCEVISWHKTSIRILHSNNLCAWN